jgi:hypothetical protein
MYTLHHGFWIYFITRHHPKVWQFVIGSMLPDYIYVILAITLLLKGYVTLPELGGVNPGLLMSLVAIFPWVVKVDLIGHSVPVWFAAQLLSLLPGIKKLRFFIIGWGSHLFIDALTHGVYSNFYLYPLAYDTVESPVSYWEHSHWSREFGFINMAAMAAAALYMLAEWWQKRQRLRKRGDNNGD